MATEAEQAAFESPTSRTMRLIREEWEAPLRATIVALLEWEFGPPDDPFAVREMEKHRDVDGVCVECDKLWPCAIEMARSELRSDSDGSHR